MKFLLIYIPIYVQFQTGGYRFDLDNYMNDGKPHIGIHNVKERLQRMVGGSLSITSTQEGTVAVVIIPEKEEIDENYCS